MDNSDKLALLGGEALRKFPFPPHPIIGEEEKKAVMDVLNNGKLSTFSASPGQYFLGGVKIREFEKIVAEYHQVKYAIAFNSATSALHAAVVACGIQPGEEVITTPYTFTATASCVLMANAIPVFADIDSDDLNLSPKDIISKISPLTKAIIPVHLFGNPAKMDEIADIAKEHNLKIIEDCAQAPGACYKNRIVGTIGDCGVLSFNEPKNISSGEGGMLITDDDKIAEVARLVRNHGEAVTAGQPRSYNSSILGWNYRMTEVDAAIGLEQFKKLDLFNSERIRLAEYLSKKINEVNGLKTVVTKTGNKNVYNVFPIIYSEEKMGIPRDIFVKALNAEGVPFAGGYVKPLYYGHLFQESKPFIYQYYKGNAKYYPGMCPNAEKMHFQKLIITVLCRPPATIKDMDDIVGAIKKVIKNKDQLVTNL